MIIDKTASDYLSTSLDPDEYLRISVKGGGCSGMMNVFALTKEITQDDVVDGKVVIDKRSLLFLKTATLLYKTGEFSSGLTVQHSADTMTCGCKKSFSP